MVVHQFGTAHCTLHLHGLVQVEVEESCASVAQHVFQQLQCVCLQSVGFLGLPCHPYLFRFLSDDCGIFWRGNWSKWCECRLFYIVARYPFAEILIDDGDGLFGVEVASHTYCYIIGAIPFVEVVLDVYYRRVLQVLLCADGGLRSVWVVGPQHLAYGVEEFPLVGTESDVVFLIHSLQFGMEAADYHVLEAVGLNLSPVLHLVGGYVLGVASNVVAGVCVRAFRTDGCHQFVVLVGDEILCRQLRDAVNLVVFLLAQFGVFDEAVFLVSLLYLVEQRSLSLGVVSAELLGALEHQVLQIVSQTSCL